MPRRLSAHTFKGHSSLVNSVVFSPDSGLVASGSADGTVKIWNAKEATSRYMFVGHSSRVISVVFSPDSALIASTSADYTVMIWNAQTAIYAHTLGGHTDFGQLRCLHPIQLWSHRDRPTALLRSGIPRRLGVRTRSRAIASSSDSVAFSPDSALVASGSADGTVKIWDVKTATMHAYTRGP